MRPAGAKQGDIVTCFILIRNNRVAACLEEHVADGVAAVAGRRSCEWRVRICEHGGCGLLTPELLPSECVLWRAVLPHSADPLALPKPADLQALPVAEHSSLHRSWNYDAILADDGQTCRIWQRSLHGGEMRQIKPQAA